MIAASDIIAAPATAPGEGAVSIVRLSGSGSAALVDEFFEGRRPLLSEPPRKMVLGAIRGVDTVLAVRFERGASYTGEESAEVHCHGGSAAAAACMELFLSAGARVAEPGEFTRRAYTSGRLDLAQAEAVLGVIRASSEEALAASRRTMQGELSSRLRDIFGAITDIAAEIEASLDWPDEVDEPTDDLARRLSDMTATIEALRERCRVGSVLRAGATIAAAGPPNAGKSSLMNALLGRERSIVSSTPGTTRDTVEAELSHGGFTFRLVDTAGLRDTTDEVERAGVERSTRAAAEADVCLFVVDVSDEAAALPSLEKFFSSIPHDARAKKIFFLARNKCDLPRGPRAIPSDVEARFDASIEVSALTGDGIGAMRDELARAVSRGVPASECFAATMRIVDALTGAADCTARAREALSVMRDAGAAGSLLVSAARYAAAPLGIDASEELLDTIFSNFCVGK